MTGRETFAKAKGPFPSCHRVALDIDWFQEGNIIIVFVTWKTRLRVKCAWVECFNWPLQGIMRRNNPLGKCFSEKKKTYELIFFWFREIANLFDEKCWLLKYLWWKFALQFFIFIFSYLGNLAYWFNHPF